MKLSYDSDDGSVKFLPKTGADEMMICALLRVFTEGGRLLVHPRSGKSVSGTIPDDSMDTAPQEVLDILAILDK